MKKFVILSFSVAGMGGGQMYQYNKAAYMKKKGYEVYIVYAIPGEIVIEGIKVVSHIICVEEINISPLVLTEKQIESVLTCICSFIGVMNNDCIIESCNKVTSLWGELLASRTGAVNHPFIIDEKIGSLDQASCQFFTYKRNNSELRGIKKETYEMLFGRKPEEDSYEYCLPIPGNNVVADIESPLINSIGGNYKRKICSIGRLDKAYVDTLAQELHIYASNHSSESICITFIGDDKDKKHIDKIRNSFLDLSNVTLFMLGSVYPIPEKLLYKFDLFISSAGSARVSGDRAIPTITIDARDFQSIGVYQYETGNTVFRDNEAAIPISEKMEYVFEHYDEIKSALHKTPQVNFDEVFDKHLNYYLNHVHTGKYYDVMSMKLDKKKKVEKIMYQCLGKKMYDKIRTFVFSKM